MYYKKKKERNKFVGKTDKQKQEKTITLGV